MKTFPEVTDERDSLFSEVELLRNTHKAMEESVDLLEKSICLFLINLTERRHLWKILWRGLKIGRALVLLKVQYYG